MFNSKMIGANSSGGGLVPLAIGDYVSDGIVIYVDPLINTTGIIISLNDFGTYALSYNNPYYSQDTPRGIWDATAATDQIISEFSGSASFAAGRARSYLDGTWDFANRSMYGLFRSNLTLIQNAISAAGGTPLTNDRHNCSDIYLQYSGNGYINPLDGNSSLHNYSNTGIIRPMKYLGDGRITEMGTLQYGHFIGASNGGSSTITIYAFDGTDWIQMATNSANSSQSYGWKDFVFGGIPKNVPLRINASYGYYYYQAPYGVRVYKTYGGNTLSDVVLSNEGSDVFQDVGTNYEAYEYSQGNFGGYSAVMYCTLT